MTWTYFAPLGSSSRWVSDVVDLATIHEGAAQIVIWQRAVDERVRAFAADVLRSHEDLEIRAEVDVAAGGGACPLPPALARRDAEGARRFGEDVDSLCQIFADLTGATRLGLRLVRLAGAMCPRFHTDYVGVRLLTTFCGTGTEWIEERAVDRRFLGHRANGADDASSGLLRPGAVVQQVPEFAVALLKGEAWPGNEGRGAVHRSPALRRGARVLLSLDVLEQEGAFEGFDRDGNGRPVPQRSPARGQACGGTP